ncbi:PH domain-containing protein [Actinophytocola xinjiangensis]|uniref:PH domain-containing protein n=1 Tax=Actinophytocola xinjiangensis TaxID=485602 RepID=UPI000A010DEB|nr:PH domain-containing protein [Actinophytocola xinjiangensis]
MSGAWERLDRRTVAVSALTVGGIAVGIAAPIVWGFVRRDGPVGLVAAIAGGGVLVLAGLVALADWLRWRHSSYRVTDERVELRYAWVVHTLRSIPRDRVRTVDLMANPLLRMFGLTKVKVGTGQQVTGQRSHLVLDPVTRVRAEQLRRELLDRAPAGAPPVAEAEPPALATLDWSWIRYAPVAVTTPILGTAAFGAVMQVADWAGVQNSVISTVGDVFAEVSVPVLVAALVAIGLLIGVVGSLGVFVEMWWRYRLTRDRGNLQVRRGLFTTRSLSLEQRRLRGVDLFEPFGARLMGAARVDVVATGLKEWSERDSSDPQTLLPAAPMAVARRVAATVLGDDPLSTVDIKGHPVAARTRRLWWATYAVVGVGGVLAVLGLLLTVVLVHLAWISVVVLTPVAVLLALDDYRNLGHGLTDGYLVTRFGPGSRHTVALQRGGIIGWTVRRSPFQRRAGLVTIAATTAAKGGQYQVRDLAEQDGLRLAEAAVPGLLTPFLEPRR